MSQIHVLDSETIDKIAAGEVVERPSSVVKELVENAIDAEASSITVEAKEGGIEFIRVTDNGSGMDAGQVRTAFLRHATSKIENADDLSHIASLGFRGEALSSIAAVSKVEMITKTRENLTGTRVTMEGALEKSFDEIGAPDGTTFLVRNLFFNTPVRRKFLKQAATEGSYIANLMEHLALSRPDISFQFVLGNQTRFHTSGNGDLREVIYRIYGRNVANALVPIQTEKNGIKIEGFLGKPILVRPNRNLEIFFVNGRFIRSNMVSRAIEEGYKEYLMQHKFPFCVLHISVDPRIVDVNVHPTKMDVRFSDPIFFTKMIAEAIHDTLQKQEMIPDASLADERVLEREEKQLRREEQKYKVPEPFEQKRESIQKVAEEVNYRASGNPDTKKDFAKSPVWSRIYADKPKIEEQQVPVAIPTPPKSEESEDSFFVDFEEPVVVKKEPEEVDVPETVQEQSEAVEIENPEQMNLFEEKLLSVENRSRYQIIGQVFDTYWLVQFEDKLFIIDQHAAHEKVKYERLMKQYQEKAVTSQRLMPPIIVTISPQEEAVLAEHMETFRALGFEIESFGGAEYALRSVPTDLYGCDEREMFLEVLNELTDGVRGNIRVVEEKIASMSCKAAVKGNNRLSRQEAEKLIDELLTLDNPYNCPHGRPTIISMTKTEMEKKFKRIV